jgi:choline dehydrogenase-like flavoprotein
MLRFEGGSKGPVILSPGFGTSAEAYTIDTTDTNLPEYLWEAGYDVWVLDYRASPVLPSANTQFTLDDIAENDYPAAVDRVLAVSGADSAQVVAHCVGSLTWLMAQASGLQGVRSGVASALTLHPRVAPLNKVRAGLAIGSFLTAMGVDTLTTEITESPDWKQRMYDQVLRLYPAGRERCNSPVCRRILFMYGEVFDHDQLNDATHDALHEMFGVANLTTLNHISTMLRKGHAVRADGTDSYLPNVERLKLPIAFLHGAHNRLFLPEGSQLTFDYLCEQNGPEHYVRHVLPEYAHMDAFIGRNAARDVYPIVRAELDRHNA